MKSPGWCRRYRLISAAPGLVVRWQITVHARLQKQIRPCVLTAPLCETDGRKKCRKKRSRGLCFYCITAINLGMIPCRQLGSKTAADSSARWLLDISWGHCHWKTALLTEQACFAMLHRRYSICAVARSLLMRCHRGVCGSDTCAMCIYSEAFRELLKLPETLLQQANIWGAPDTKV